MSSREKKKPDFIPAMFSMDHVPPPDPENFWWLDLNEPRVILAHATQKAIEPVVTVVVRKIEGGRVALQIVAAPSLSCLYKQ